MSDVAADTHPFALLTPDYVLDAVESLDLLSDARILTLNSYENRVYQIGIEDAEPIIAKFYRPQRWSEAAILEEHQFTLDLAAAELPVVAPIVIKDQSLFHYDQFLFAIFPRRGGYAPDFSQLENLNSLGRTLGRIHALGQRRTLKHRGEFSLSFFIENSREYLLESDFLPPHLIDQYRQTSARLLEKMQQLYQQFDLICLHGDCHAGNILWRDNHPHFVDFDDVRMGPAIQDLWMMLSGTLPEQQRQIHEILNGYREFCDFNPSELSLIESLRTMRIMHYAAWLARRWQDPAFPQSFPWFGEPHYWQEHLNALEQQALLLEQPPLRLGYF